MNHSLHKYHIIAVLALFSYALYFSQHDSTLTNLNFLGRQLQSNSDNTEKYVLLSEPQIQEICNTRALRFLTIGSTTVVGKGLEYPLTDSYPVHLCNSDIIASETMHPREPAECLNSIIGDKIFDVIVLDFYEQAGNTNFVYLIIRLRKRFPEALIVILKAYKLVWTGYFDKSTGNWTDVSQWALHNGHKTLNDEVLGDFSDSTEIWKVNEFRRQEEFSTKQTRKSDVYQVYKENTTTFEAMSSGNVKDLLIRRSYLYSDWSIFTTLGHEDIALGILKLVDLKVKSQNDTVKDWKYNKDKGCEAN